MNSFDHFVQACSGLLAYPRAGNFRRAAVAGRAVLLPLALLAAVLLLATAARAQSVPDATAGGYRISAGGTASAYDLDYGQVKKYGASVFVDFDSITHFGVEGEARWLPFALDPRGPGPAADEHASVYLIGPRYSREYGKFQPYAKALVGIGEFNFPYNLGTDSSLVVAPGVGLDYRLTKRISWRAVDVEYQIWPNFQYGPSQSGVLKSYGISSGIRIKIY